MKNKYDVIRNKVFFRNFLMALLMQLCLIPFAFAQEASVTGRVTDENDSGLPGVNVVVEGTSQGTVTDIDGRYSLEVEQGSTLLFSFTGYTREAIVVGNESVINVQMTPELSVLEEIVVTGYTSQRKKDITGAVSVVDTDELKAVKAANIGQQLAGKATGVTTSTAGTPGGGTNIRIRGISSFASSDPLIIIDGVQVQGDKALNGLNPNDIESMQVLKDAASASIYGARANAGVIIITTKRGKKGKVSVTYDGYYGSQSPVGGYNDFLIKDPARYAEWHTQANPSTNSFYGSPISIPTYFFPINADGTPNPNVDESTYNYPTDPRQEPTLIMRSNQEGTDWWDEVFDPAPITNHTIGISGGSENGTFAASIDYFRQDGTMIHTYFERLSARINSELYAGRFTFGESLSFARSTSVAQSGGNQNEQNTMTQILKLNSIVPVYDIGGNFASAKTIGFSNGTNPVARQVRDKDDESIDFNVLANVFGKFDITDYLSAKTSFSVDFAQNFDQNFSFPTWENREFNGNNFFSEDHRTYFTWTWTNTLQFQKTFAEKHALGALVGYEAVSQTNRGIGGRVDNFGFTSTDIRYLALSLASYNNVYSDVERDSYFNMASIFAKVDYTYDDKYLFSATIRRDGSSNFSDDQRYGNFPAVSAGWRISEEAFMQNTSWLTDLKIRGGWGITGNQKAQAFNAVDLYGARSTYDANYNITGDNTGNSSGFTQTAIGNPETGWEENQMWNIGFDASLLDGRLNMVLDVYNKTITDLLFEAPYPGSAGNADVPFRNVAEMTNNGWDFSANYRSNINNDFSYNIGLNLSQYKNEVVALVGGTDVIFPGGVDKRFGEVNAFVVGSPISSFYGYQLDGIFQNQAEVDALEQAGAAPGRFRWKDLNDDGQINDEDKGVIGSPHPDLTMGLNIGLNYKNFDFSTFIFGSFGNDIYNYNKIFTHRGFFNSNVSEDVLTNSWTSEGSGGTLPKIDGDDSFSTESSTFYVEDGTYVRAQTITLGYTFPANTVFQSLRVYVQAQNAFTISGYDGIDPALSNVDIGDGNQNDSWTGFDFGNYPSSRVFMAGLNVTF